MAKHTHALTVSSTPAGQGLSRGVVAEGQFIEGWMRGTYIVAGIFAIPSEVLTVTEVQRNIPTLYEATKKAKRGWWPRGLSGMYLFPFYLGRAFESEVIDWVQRRRPYRWAIWHEPVLYDVTRNAVWMRSDYGHFGSAFHPLVFELYRRALTVIAGRIQKPAPDFINDAPTNGRSF
jgi:hypothetical protein